MKKVFSITGIQLMLVMSLWSQTPGELNVSFQTSDTGGKYKPRNVVSVWIENESGTFIKTLLAYADKRKTHLNTWQASTLAASNEFNVVDAITGATKSSHAVRSCKWDGTDHNKAEVPDGIYKVRMELTDKNSTGNFSSFSFVKGEAADTVSPDDVASFNSISIRWTPVSTYIESVAFAEDQLIVYPNPGRGIFNIQIAGILDIEVRDLSGKLIASFHNSTGVIDLSNQADGIYIACIRTRSSLHHIRMIKKH